eukprot:CAMPEP_0180227494 /NCGR_PEP_ID=MMETSP0987-20121128/24158_1 /TAXON_ID=697907 /ORGANISM="non described non described, Strain CCMP2293" /LENGTH=262 /DNA_ID=CAMNT_0022191421 /DNA_START=172 /DNA_END=956 /DNA_ORIENTATION=-
MTYPQNSRRNPQPQHPRNSVLKPEEFGLAVNHRSGDVRGIADERRLGGFRVFLLPPGDGLDQLPRPHVHVPEGGEGNDAIGLGVRHGFRRRCLRTCRLVLVGALLAAGARAVALPVPARHQRVVSPAAVVGVVGVGLRGTEVEQLHLLRERGVVALAVHVLRDQQQKRLPAVARERQQPLDVVLGVRGGREENVERRERFRPVHHRVAVLVVVDDVGKPQLFEVHLGLSVAVIRVPDAQRLLALPQPLGELLEQGRDVRIRL